LIRRNWTETLLLPVSLVVGSLAGCDYSRDRSADVPIGSYRPGFTPLPGSSSAHKSTAAARESLDRATILASSIELIQRAALQPGGKNFEEATRQLTQYFEGTPRSEYLIESPIRAYLEPQFPRVSRDAPDLLTDAENPNWVLRDARHLEDCMLYSGIAARIGGTGDDLIRVRRIFDWLVRQIQLAPAGSLGTRQLPQVVARPYDVLLRGLATESEGFWAERSWLFMALCRQLGVDVGLLTYSKGNVVEPRVRRTDQEEGSVLPLAKVQRPAIFWICAALIDGKAYLFDARIGLPVPSPDGKSVATLDQALADPAILERMDLPGQSPYGTSRASLLASSSKIGVMLDSSPGFFTPKMRLLQRELTGKNRTILYRDPLEERDHFVRVVGDRCGQVKLWSVPVEVMNQLFTNAQFVQATQQSLLLFRPQFPLVYARVKQLRGNVAESVKDYVSFRLIENLLQVDNKKLAIPREISKGLDIYATNYLALAHLEQNNLERAEDMFLMLLDMLPEPGPNQPYFNMFRWGAHANLGRIYEARGQKHRAIFHYSQGDATMQRHGNLLRARELAWDDPMAIVADPVVPAPGRTSKP
jgi:hypothetical protein